MTATPELRVRISLRRIVEQLFGESSPEIYPFLASLMGVTEDATSTPTFELGAEELQQRTFAAVGRLLEQLAEGRPIVVAIEDLHWADATSTQLVTSLLQIVERAAVVIVTTQRDERDHVAWALKEAAARDYPHLVHEIALDPLPPDAEQSLLEQLLGGDVMTEKLKHRVLGAAEGNPLFLEELVRSLADGVTHGCARRR